MNIHYLSKVMARRARLRMPGQPFHVIQRGNNRAACFYADEDYQFYLYHLEQLAKKHEVSVHAYVLMTNHVHLLMTGEKQESLSDLMKYLGQRYVQYVNKMYKRTGTLWEGRFKSCLIDADEYLLQCQRYIELNPVRANMVAHPADYRWSSYRINAQGESDTLITQHAIYAGLAITNEQRHQAYRKLFRNQLDPGVVDDIRQSTNGGYVMGREDFKGQIEKALKQRTTRGRPGRPVKKKSVSQIIDQQMEL